MTGPVENVCFRPIVPISAQDANGSNRCMAAPHRQFQVPTEQMRPFVPETKDNAHISIAISAYLSSANLLLTPLPSAQSQHPETL